MNTILDTLTQLSDKTSRTNTPKINAKWFEIGFKPDLGSMQIITIGTGVIYQNQLFTKLLTDTKLFELLYGAAAKENVNFLINLISKVSSYAALKQLSRNLFLSKPKFIAGETINEMLDRSFNSVVTSPIKFGQIYIK